MMQIPPCGAMFANSFQKLKPGWVACRESSTFEKILLWNRCGEEAQFRAGGGLVCG